MMMRKTTLIVTFAALAFAAGCGKKKDEPKKTPPVTTPTTPTTPTATTPTPVTPPPAPVPLVGEALGKRFIECHGYWSASDKEKFKGCYAKDATSRFVDSMMPELKGTDAIVGNAMDFHAAFPDGKNVPQLVLVNGRNVASVVWFTGTNTAPMKMGGQEMPATGKKVGMNMLHMVTFNDANQATEEWWLMDDTTLGTQLGMPGSEGGRPVADKGMEGAPKIVVASDSDAEKANHASYQKATASFNSHDLKAMMADWAPDAVESDQASPADTVGTKDIEKNTKMFLTAFPDGKLTTLKSWAAGDYVVAVGTFTGTNTGAMGPMKKTGKPVSLTVGEVTHLEAGKVKHLWRFYNGHSMAVQLGWAPDPSKMAPPAGGSTGSAAGSGMGSMDHSGSGMGSMHHGTGSATGSAGTATPATT